MKILQTNLKEAQKVKENEVITVQYTGTNVHNKLIFPTFMRSRNNRTDLSWKELVDQYNNNVNNQ